MSYSILDERQHAGIYRCTAAQWPVIEVAAKARELQALGAHFSHVSTAADMLQQMARDLRFPAWFGNNLDALHDVLTDPDWHHGQPQVIHLSCQGDALPCPRETWESLQDVLESAVDIRKQAGAPLWVIVGFDDPHLPTLPSQLSAYERP